MRKQNVETNARRDGELGPSEWPTCDQERELHCVRHHTDETFVRRFDGVVFAFELVLNNEAVTVFAPAPIQHHACVDALRRAGMTILLDDGNKIIYVG